MRTFIAIKITPEPQLLQILTELKKEFAGDSVKWVDEKHMHLTLKFLGDTSTEQVSSVKDVLVDLTAGYSSFLFQPGCLGSFNSKNTPRVIYIGIHDSGHLVQLASDIDNYLSPFGFHKENRPFNPHLTLARIKFLKNSKIFYDILEKYRHFILQPLKVTEIRYFQSILRPSGPVYDELAIFPLAKEEEYNERLFK
jgi:RNA 2',3'-cyclic 3'-phosphodiesterase